MASEQQDYINLNGEEYEFAIVLSNPDKTIRLPKRLFQTLVVTESLMNWEFRGHLDFINDFEQIERFMEDEKKKNSELFYFRMDGTDRIEIYLKPTFSAANNSPYTRKLLSDPVVSTMFLYFYGAIYDTEDLEESTIDSKLKRLYFWDATYNEAVESVLPVSSGEYIRKTVTGSDPSNMTDADRSTETGAMLKYILETKLEQAVSKTKWDVGINKIIYASPASFTLYDNLDAIFNMHVSRDGYPAILTRNRFNNEFELISYDSLFSSYTSQLKERFTFPDSTNRRVPIGPARAIKSNVLDFGAFSVMEQGYKYDKMAGMDNMKAITTKSINWYDPVGKKFNVSVEQNTAVVAKDKFKVLASKLNASRSTALLPINKMKTANESIEHRYRSSAFASNADSALGVCETLKGALFLNDCISFSALGIPARSAGQFIEIRSDVDLQGVWEDRFLGAWLSVGVTHIITENTYVNKIVAIKPNTTENFDVPEDV